MYTNPSRFSVAHNPSLMTRDRMQRLVAAHETITVSMAVAATGEPLGDITATVRFAYSPDRTPVLVANTSAGHEVRLPVETAAETSAGGVR